MNREESTGPRIEDERVVYYHRIVLPPVTVQPLIGQTVRITWTDNLGMHLIRQAKLEFDDAKKM